MIAGDKPYLSSIMIPIEQSDPIVSEEIQWKDITNNFIQIYDPWDATHYFTIEELKPYITIKFEYSVASFDENDTLSYDHVFSDVRLCSQDDFEKDGYGSYIYQRDMIEKGKQYLCPDIDDSVRLFGNLNSRYFSQKYSYADYEIHRCNN